MDINKQEEILNEVEDTNKESEDTKAEAEKTSVETEETKVEVEKISAEEDTHKAEVGETEASEKEVAEKPKKKIKWFDNALIYLVATFLLMLAGQLLGTFLVNIPVGMYLGVKAAANGMTAEEIAQGGLEIPPVLYTATMYLAFIGIWIVVLLWFLKKNNRPLFKTINTHTKGNNVKMLLFGLLIGFLMNGTCILAAYINKDISLYFDSFKPLALLLVFVCVFVQSSAEELLCRGYLYQKLIKRYKKPAVAIVGNAVLFGLLHVFNPGVTPLAIANIIMVGILFSLIVYYLDSMWCAFALHASWNFTQNIIFGLPNSGQVVPFSIFKLDVASARDSLVYNVGFGVESTVFALFVEILVCVLIILWGKKKGNKATDIWA